MITGTITPVTISINIGLTIAHSCGDCDSHHSSGSSHQAFIRAEAAGTVRLNAVRITTTAAPKESERKRTPKEENFGQVVGTIIKLVRLERQLARLAGRLLRRGGIMADRMITGTVTLVTIRINSGMTVRASH